MEEFKQSFELSYMKGTFVDMAKQELSTRKRYHRAYKRYIKLEENLIDKMTVFNASSLALRSVLEALRLAEGKTVREPRKASVRRV